ncbi:MAG TPA: hypothetical protein VLL08_33295 [Kineosporiaceae bacterium]|nr:hypothetical protein [Kineosporiaceae bacterium]
MDEPPTPPGVGRLGRRTGVALAALVVGLTITVVGVVLTQQSNDSPPDSAPTALQPTGQPPSDDPAPTPEPSPTDPPSPAGPTPTEDPASDPDSVALAQLKSYRTKDLARISMHNQWVAQLASKAPGYVDRYATASDGTHRFKLPDILAEHQALRDSSALGNVFLLKTTDYGKRKVYDGEALWVTFADNDFSSAAAVHRWCDEQFSTLSTSHRNEVCAVRRLRPPQ